MELGSWADSRYQQQYTIQPSPQASLPNAFIHLMPSMEQTKVQTQHPFLLSSNALTPHPHLPQTKIGKFLCTSSLTFIYFPTQYLSLHHFLHIFCLTSHPLHNMLSYPSHIPSPFSSFTASHTNILLLFLPHSSPSPTYFLPPPQTQLLFLNLPRLPYMLPHSCSFQLFPLPHTLLSSPCSTTTFDKTSLLH